MHVELRWSKPAKNGPGRVAVARLYIGYDNEMKEIAGTIACSPEAMNTIDRVLREGAQDVSGVTYLGAEVKEELW